MLSLIVAILTTLMGFLALFIAIYSLESSTLKLDEIQADYWNMRGIDHLDRKEYYRAFQAFDRGFRSDRRSIRCLINKANAKCIKGERFRDEASLDDALDTIDYAISLGPIWPPAILKHKTQQEVPITQTREDKARQEYANAIKSKCDILIHRADLLKDKKKAKKYLEDWSADKIIEEAIKEYLKINPRYESQLPGAYSTQGTILYKMERYDEAVTAIDAAINLEPNEALLRAIKGQALEAKGDQAKIKNFDEAIVLYKAAIEAFDKAIELKPEDSKFSAFREAIAKKLAEIQTE